jgi:hypothetical protein
MLESSFIEINKSIRKRKNKKNLNIQAIRTDFLAFDKNAVKLCLDKGNGKRVFLLLGCTLCNINEDYFFSSLNKIITKGDVLIISVNIKNEKFNNFDNSYDNNAVKDFLQLPLKQIKRYCDNILEIETCKFDDGKTLKIETTDQWSSIPNTETKKFVVKVKYIYSDGRDDDKEIIKDVTIAVTSKYDKDSLIGYVESKKYSKIYEMQSQTKDFVYLMFEKE